jgi:hypothetical protein
MTQKDSALGDIDLLIQRDDDRGQRPHDRRGRCRDPGRLRQLGAAQRGPDHGRLIGDVAAVNLGKTSGELCDYQTDPSGICPSSKEVKEEVKGEQEMSRSVV